MREEEREKEDDACSTTATHRPCDAADRYSLRPKKKCKSRFLRSQTLLILTKFIKKLQTFVSSN